MAARFKARQEKNRIRSKHGHIKTYVKKDVKRNITSKIILLFSCFLKVNIYNKAIMKTKTLLNQIKKGYGISWHETAKMLDISYSYVCFLRRSKREAGKHLKDKIDFYYIDSLGVKDKEIK